MIKKIGIIGANGQLGSEVCLLLRQMEGVQPVPICRNQVGAIFLRRCGLDVRIGTLDDEATSRDLLAELDLVADFSLPSGSSSYVRSQMSQTISHAVRFAPAKASFVYLSSILAFGNPDFHSELRDYAISRNAYGSTKRYAERLVKRLSVNKRDAYIFRVGVVHGELQAATRQALKDLRSSAHLTAYLPACDTYTVFAFTVAEALVSVLRQTNAPGTYTLVSNPAWSWSDLHRYLCETAGVHQRVVLTTSRESTSVERLQFLKEYVFRALRRHKEFINGYVGAVLPGFEQRMRAQFHSRNAAAEIRRGIMESRYMPFFDNFTVYPGKRLRGISDSREAMAEPAIGLRQIIKQISN